MATICLQSKYILQKTNSENVIFSVVVVFSYFADWYYEEHVVIFREPVIPKSTIIPYADVSATVDSDIVLYNQTETSNLTQLENNILIENLPKNGMVKFK